LPPRTTIVLLAVLLVPVWWAAVLVAPIFARSESISGIAGAVGLAQIVADMTAALQNPFHLTWTTQTPRFLLTFSIAYLIGIAVYFSTRRNTRPGEEYGSAVWGDAKQINAKYRAPNPLENVILTQNVRIGLDGRKHRRNLNVLVVGGSGAGKSRFYAKPNIMQANTSLIVSDPKGEALRDTGHLLAAKGYEIRVIDLINPSASHGYNPFHYIRDDKDVLKLITNLIRNTTPKGAGSSEPFWEKSETALLQALMLYLIYEAPKHEQNFEMVMELLRSEEAREEDSGEQPPSILDILFEDLAMREPGHIAVKQYQIYKQAPAKTASSILISVGVRLAAFNLPAIAGMTMYDELDLASLGEKKVALFCLIPDNDTSFNFLIGMLYTQAFQELYYQADRVHGGRLPIHVHAVMDEFPNVALPDDFDKLLATMRSREISVSIIIQNMAQIRALYKDQWESLVGNCDHFLFLGGNETGTHEYLSKALGKATIDTTTHGQTKGRSGSYSTNMQQTGRELMLPNEVRTMDNADCLLLIRGEPPIMDKKYDLMRHPNIGLTPDGGGKPYLHGQLTLFSDDLDIDMARVNDYVVLTVDEVLGTNKEDATNEVDDTNDPSGTDNSHNANEKTDARN